MPFEVLLGYPIASTPLSDEVARLLVDHYGPRADPAQMTTLQCEDVTSLLDTVAVTDAIFLGIAARAGIGPAPGNRGTALRAGAPLPHPLAGPRPQALRRLWKSGCATEAGSNAAQ
ncbi:hypothetical protein [Candidatus Skiveiella danica]|uniref:hypothetical protein n=1 Tax=Candidatus Skiveiella danica TaxID=3386177 RepID=UPI0039B95CC5